MSEIQSTLIPTDHKLYKHFPTFSEAYWIGPHHFCFPKYGPEVLKNLQKFQAREDDVYVVTFPKTGTTWMQEIVYLLMNDLDFDKASKTKRDDDVPYLDMQVWEEPTPDIITVINNKSSPRAIKSHLNYSLLPPDILNKKCKIIYVSRNAKDTLVSYYHFSVAMYSTKFQGSLEDFTEFFMKNEVPYTPFITHIKEFWERKNETNIFFTTYEEMSKDLPGVIKEVAKFLNKSFSIEEIEKVADHCTFNNMKNNPKANKADWDERGFLHKKDFKFMRKGKVDGWKDEMSPELITRFDQWLDEGTSGSAGLREVV